LPHKDREARAKSQAAYFQRNKRKWKGYQRKYDKRAFEAKQGRACKECGFDNPLALQWHHRDPNTKLFTIGHGNKKACSDEKFWAEVAKCDLLCANCHILHHLSGY